MIVCACVMAIYGCEPGPDTVSEAHKQLVRRYFSEVWSGGNPESIGEICSPDFVGHFPIGSDWSGLDALREQVANHRIAFPDWTERPEIVLAEGDLVAVRWSSMGTNLGVFGGNPPTGKKVSIYELGIFRIANGKIAEQWVIPDLLGFERQLDVSLSLPTEVE